MRSSRCLDNKLAQKENQTRIQNICKQPCPYSFPPGRPWAPKGTPEAPPASPFLPPRAPQGLQRTLRDSPRDPSSVNPLLLLPRQARRGKLRLPWPWGQRNSLNKRSPECNTCAERKREGRHARNKHPTNNLGRHLFPDSTVRAKGWITPCGWPAAAAASARLRILRSATLVTSRRTMLYEVMPPIGPYRPQPIVEAMPYAYVRLGRKAGATLRGCRRPWIPRGPCASPSQGSPTRWRDCPFRNR